MTSPLAGFPFRILPPTEDDKMIPQLDERLDELRQMYKASRDSEYLYRYLEAQRLREIAVNEQIRREQSVKRGTRRSED